MFLEGGWGNAAHVWAYNYSTSTPEILTLNLPGGNVGIGTQTPASRLEIAGSGDNLTLSGTHPFMTLKDTNAGNATGIIQCLSGDVALIPNNVGGSPGLIVKRDTDRVGMGTVNPTARLHVASSTANQAAIYGVHGSNFTGVRGESTSGTGTEGISATWAGVYGQSNSNSGVWGNSTTGFGVYGEAVNSSGVGGYFRNLAGGEALHVDGKAAVKTLQILGGADIVEGFETGDDVLEPGTVVVIDDQHPGELRASTRAYDNRVAGVVSGAGGVAAGLHLGQGCLNGETAVAMTGRVYVRCTAQNGRIRPGDLLTTSNQSGCAMRASQAERSLGAILGKAMTSLDAGSGLVLVLVNLQ